MSLHPAFPPLALAQHTAILGKTGSGKTSTAKLAIEQVVADGARVCVLDPIKSDWWGLTARPDRKRAGLPFVILGGPRGHVPLHSSAGKAIGEIVARGDLPLSIIDMADFEAGGLQRFFIDFAQALLRNMRGVVYLVIEEAHEFAPKERSGFGQENLAIHWAKKLATAGRSKGIRLILATQRTQSLHNALLGSCETMVVHRMTAPADQGPVKDWLKANTAKAVQEQVATSLSSLKTGTGWICSGEAGIFERKEFPRITTFDNSATPTHDSQEHKVTTAAVDTEALRSIIGDAVKEAEANDPAKLNAEITRLQIELRNASAAAGNDGGELSAAKRREADLRTECERSHNENKLWREKVETLRDRLASMADGLDHFPDLIREQLGEAATRLLPAPVQQPSVQPKPTLSRPSQASSGLKPALQRVLDALAWWRKIGFDPVERDRAAVVAGYSPKASTFGVYIADLVKLGLVETSPGKAGLTAEGLKVAHTPEASTREDLRVHARSLLKPQEQRVFDVIYAAWPNEIARDAVAGAVGLSPTASTCGVYIAGVAAYGLIVPGSRGHMRAAGWLFP